MLIALVLSRQNLVQRLIARFFGPGQAAMRRRLTALRDPIRAALADPVADPYAAAGDSTVLIDGALASTCGWRAAR